MSNGQAFPPLWLAWVGERTLPLETVWFKYLRRFGVDHWYIAVLKKVRIALCPMPYALCPMPYALCRIVPHLSEKGYRFAFATITLDIA